MIAKIADRRKAEGFTLIELLVVIVILVALAAIAIPVFLNQKANADDAANSGTVTSIGSFLASGIANGSLDDADSPVAGPGSVLSTKNGSIAVPAGFTATWNSTTGTFCVEGQATNTANPFTYDSAVGEVAPGANC